MIAELEERIDTLESMDESRFGPFTRLDWILTTIGSLLVPYLAYIWFWP